MFQYFDVCIVLNGKIVDICERLTSKEMKIFLHFFFGDGIGGWVPESHSINSNTLEIC